MRGAMACAVFWRQRVKALPILGKGVRFEGLADGPIFTGTAFFQAEMRRIASRT